MFEVSLKSICGPIRGPALSCLCLFIVRVNQVSSEATEWASPGQINFIDPKHHIHPPFDRFAFHGVSYDCHDVVLERTVINDVANL